MSNKENKTMISEDAAFGIFKENWQKHGHRSWEDARYSISCYKAEIKLQLIASDIEIEEYLIRKKELLFEQIVKRLKNKTLQYADTGEKVIVDDEFIYDFFKETLNIKTSVAIKGAKKRFLKLIKKLDFPIKSLESIWIFISNEKEFRIESND